MKNESKNRELINTNIIPKWKNPTREKIHSFRVHTETKLKLIELSHSELEDINNLLEQTIWGIVSNLKQHQVAVNINYQHIDQQQTQQVDITKLKEDIYAFFRQHTLPVYSEVLKELEKDVLKKYGN